MNPEELINSVRNVKQDLLKSSSMQEIYKSLTNAFTNLKTDDEAMTEISAVLTSINHIIYKAMETFEKDENRNQLFSTLINISDLITMFLITLSENHKDKKL